MVCFTYFSLLNSTLASSSLPTLLLTPLLSSLPPPSLPLLYLLPVPSPFLTTTFSTSPPLSLPSTYKSTHLSIHSFPYSIIQKGLRKNSLTGLCLHNLLHHSNLFFKIEKIHAILWNKLGDEKWIRNMSKPGIAWRSMKQHFVKLRKVASFITFRFAVFHLKSSDIELKMNGVIIWEVTHHREQIRLKKVGLMMLFAP